MRNSAAMEPPPSRGIIVPLMERETLCLPSLQPGIASHSGEEGFPENVQKWYDVAENNAIEKLVALKAELKGADTETFWRRLMEGMTTICNAQYAFVAKRILVDDHNLAVEMPLIGEPGSCLLGVAFYYNDGEENVGLLRDYKYLAWGAPCAHMRHNKVFLIPERLNSFITNNPNKFPFPTEAYLGVPLFSEGKCFAHFGMMWTANGLEKRDLGWGTLEMVLHALEDLILERLLLGESFARPTEQNNQSVSKIPKVIPQEAITASQSLKPYARSLSHELRTPMQGVVGMLDVMHATVQEAVEGHTNPKIRNIFQALRENIEVVQDSSRRAVEAADNVVLAYDLNMQVPDTPQDHMEEGSPDILSSTSVFENRPNILIETIPVNPYKRRRSSPIDWAYGPAPKHRAVKPSPRRELTAQSQLSPRSEDLKIAVEESDKIMRASPEEVIEYANDKRPLIGRRSSTRGSGVDDGMPGAVRNTHLRDLIHLVINESLRVGGRPDSAIGEDTQLGEKIEVRHRSSSGHATTKIIEWSVDPMVPETILIDERDLTKLISSVFLNALKFTEQGNITVKANLSPRNRYIVINVTDTGDGIKESFIPRLFGAFSREDDSTTRPKEGLGLGLMVAKGIARRLGGDLTLVRTSTSGSDKGSEFEIKVPKSPSDASSQPATPYRSPTPGSRNNSYYSGDVTTNPSPKRHNSTSHPQPHASPDLRRESLHPSAAKGGSASPEKSSKQPTPLNTSSPSRQNSPRGSKDAGLFRRQSSTKKPLPPSETFNRNLAKKYPLNFLVAEDNRINRKLLVNMLEKLGYKDILEAFDGREAVRLVTENLASSQSSTNKKGKGKSPPALKPIDIVLMDLWMPVMDGYEATENILKMFDEGPNSLECPTVVAVTADATDEAIHRATKFGMEGYMTKPYKLIDLQKLIVGTCERKHGQDRGRSR